MNRFSHWAVIGSSFLAMGGCNAPVPPPVAAPTGAADSGDQQLERLVERYWDENAALTPWYASYGAGTPFAATPAAPIAPQTLADSLALERRYLDLTAGITPSGLGAPAARTLEMFRRQRRTAIEGLKYPFELMPVNPFDDRVQEFASSAAALERQGLVSGKDYDVWRAQAQNFVSWTRQAIDNLRAGLRRGYTLPRPLVMESLSQLAALGTDGDANVFYQPLRPADGAAAEAMHVVVRSEILPSLRALHDFLQTEYLPRARTSVGLAALPLGEAWYAFLVRRVTAGPLTPSQLHALGVAEVERLHPRLQELLTEAGFPGDLAGFLEHLRHDPRVAHTTVADLTSAYQDLKVQVAGAMGPVAAMPRGDFALRLVEPYREAVMRSLTYHPHAPEGPLGAALFVNPVGIDARPVVDVTARYLQEAVPGHHLQLELQHERTDLPRFRRFGREPVFVDGWGLYAATLGTELGLYTAPEARFGSLRAQLDCAAGLVIDTGLHAEHWTREQALEYLHAHVPDEGTAPLDTVDRAIAMPGQALACTVGYLKIQALRALAQQTLGSRFDLAAFHAALLGGGAMPPDLLEATMRDWLSATVAAEAAEAKAANEGQP